MALETLEGYRPLMRWLYDDVKKRGVKEGVKEGEVRNFGSVGFNGLGDDGVAYCVSNLTSIIKGMSDEEKLLRLSEQAVIIEELYRALDAGIAFLEAAFSGSKDGGESAGGDVVIAITIYELRHLKNFIEQSSPFSLNDGKKEEGEA